MTASKNKPPAACLAVLGTGSDVGKSVITTALCRLYADRGLKVAPFKAQNMSNNSGVTAEGLEMGRAQIVQAEACRIAPHVDMNPILLKPTSDVGAQVVVLGTARNNATAMAYHRQKEALFTTACQALDRLRGQYDLVIMEGAGSCAEVNLLDGDIVNLRMAAWANAPVILVADIHRGGVFAQIVGTLACLNPEQRRQIKGSIINRFRGDLAVFRDGAGWIAERTGRPVFGVLPWYSDFAIEAEDSVVIEQPARRPPDNGTPVVAVIRLPHISNFTDMAPLEEIDDLSLVYLETAQPLSGCRAVILPGSKSTRSDLEWLHATGWTRHLNRYRQDGGHILGICGGYQMLGRQVEDPDGVEGTPGTTAGLNLLPVVTELKAPKTTTRTRFEWGRHGGLGYEIHMGVSRLEGGRPLVRITGRNGTAISGTDGCVGENGQVMGTYIHGLFDSPAVTSAWLESIGLAGLDTGRNHGPSARDLAYDQLAAHFASHMDTAALDRLAGLG